MSHRHPTLAELRATVHKQRHREIGNWLARRFARPAAIYGTWAAVRIGLSAHQVTLAALTAALAGAVAIGTGDRACFVVGAVLTHLFVWLDHVDGQVARWHGTTSLNGVYLDYLMHHLHSLTLGFALGFGLASRSGQPAWAIAGLALAAGLMLLSLHNDCRYKAFFQRLKSSSQTFLVIGGSGGRPAPPASWPRRGIGLVSWPLYKLCEGHAVLITVTVLAVLAVLDARSWLAGWRTYTLVLALLAPGLAAARIARAIKRGSIESEFSRWFQTAAVGGGNPRPPRRFPPTAPWTARSSALYHQAKCGLTKGDSQANSRWDCSIGVDDARV